jgi:type II secretory pathway component PulM
LPVTAWVQSLLAGVRWRVVLWLTGGRFVDVQRLTEEFQKVLAKFDAHKAALATEDEAEGDVEDAKDAVAEAHANLASAESFFTQADVAENVARKAFDNEMEAFQVFLNSVKWTA